MDATVEFYCGLLGLMVKVTFGNNFKPGGMIATTGDMVTSISDYSRIYFFELPNGDGLGFVELPGRDTKADSSWFDGLWPDGRGANRNPRKMDHISFDLKNLDDLAAMRKRLVDHGIKVSEIQKLTGALFIRSIYLTDPVNGIPIEFSTWDLSDPAWDSRTEKDMFADTEEVAGVRGRKASLPMRQV